MKFVEVGTARCKPGLHNSWDQVAGPNGVLRGPKRRVHFHFHVSLERARHDTSIFGCRGQPLKRCFIDAGHDPDNGEIHLRDRELLPTFSSVQVAVVAMLVDGVPFFSSAAASAML